MPIPNERQYTYRYDDHISRFVVNVIGQCGATIRPGKKQVPFIEQVSTINEFIAVVEGSGKPSALAGPSDSKLVRPHTLSAQSFKE
jgi:hypothetical protein